jgi:NADH dehydrogenase FAD-containing subunit
MYAAGDAAFVSSHPIPIRMACATAMPMGGHVADNVRAHLRGEPEQPFRLRYFAQCISLGRQDALIQVVNPDDSPREQVITGRAGALVKELICRFTLATLRLERHFPGAYRVPPLKGEAFPVPVRYERV